MRRLMLPAAVLALLLGASIGLASQVHCRSLHQVAGSIGCVLKVRITGVKKGDVRMKLEDGKDGPITSSWVEYTGEVTECVYGKTRLKTVKARHSVIVPIQYDKKGKKVLHFSYEVSWSGSELNLEKGKSYLLCFRSVNEKGGTQGLLRAEPLARKSVLLRHIAESRAWKLLRKYYKKELDDKKVRTIASFDAARKKLLAAIGTKVYIVDGMAGTMQVADTRLAISPDWNNVFMDDQKVVVRRNDADGYRLYMRHFKPDPRLGAARKKEKPAAK